jgi:NAD(P)-dependent dehydrogenase (short-subunit alcohol dehydrogenase family)
MAARAGGSISNVGSEAGHIGLPGGAAYSATKGALASMARLGPPSSAPLAAGAVPNVYTAIQPDAETEAQAATAPMSRVAQPDEIAEVITFLASPKASYFTGAIVAADGGRTAI